MDEIERLPRVQAEVLRQLRDAGGRSHAYDIKRALHGKVGHSSVYAALSALQAKGMVDAKWQDFEPDRERFPPRKYFTLNAVGTEALAATERESVTGASPQWGPASA